jgi:hypothetical protein
MAEWKLSVLEGRLVIKQSGTSKEAMNRAFVQDAEDKVDDLPDCPISPHHNFVAAAGLAAIDAGLGRFEAPHAAATAEGKTETGTAALREVRYWRRGARSRR